MVQNTKEILIWVGLVAAVSAGAAGLLGSGVISSAQTESLEIVESSIKKAGDSSILTIAIKNAGTSAINHIVVQVNDVTLGENPVDFTAGDAKLGYTPSVTRQPGGNVAPIIITGLTTLSNAVDCDPSCTITFNDVDESVSAGETIYYSATIPESDNLSIGNSFTITAEGRIGNTNDNPIVASGVVTITGF